MVGHQAREIALGRQGRRGGLRPRKADGGDEDDDDDDAMDDLVKEEDVVDDEEAKDGPKSGSADMDEDANGDDLFGDDAEPKPVKDRDKQLPEREDPIRQYVRAARDRAEAEAGAIAPLSRDNQAPHTPIAYPKKRAGSPKASPGASPPRKRATGRQKGSASIDDEPDFNLMTSPARHLERRRTKTWQDRQQMTKAHQALTNLKPSLSKKHFANCGDFANEIQRYQDKHLVVYRERNSQTREKGTDTRSHLPRLQAHVVHPRDEDKYCYYWTVPFELAGYGPEPAANKGFIAPSTGLYDSRKNETAAGNIYSG
ncbi:uncharacterized protein IUM83_06375 [Phytophthora cinnamomi]|uniref:uncharacterized protein n=1 Tax=Phytophthora cinnamomi TaxID=4785 RepID=UPI003559F5F0|nr:hypothetical protein IUM83_06375 [Phytophthora cinnamomi]